MVMLVVLPTAVTVFVVLTAFFYRPWYTLLKTSVHEHNLFVHYGGAGNRTPVLCILLSTASTCVVDFQFSHVPESTNGERDCVSLVLIYGRYAAGSICSQIAYYPYSSDGDIG